MSGVLTRIIGNITDAFPLTAPLEPPASAVQTNTLPATTVSVTDAIPTFSLHTLPGPGPPPTGEIPPLANQTFTAFPTDSSSPTSLLATSTSSTPGAGDQETAIQTSTRLVSSSFAPTSTANVNLTASSASSFIKNHAVIIGIAAGAGLLVALLLIYFITRIVRSRRQRRLDHELDISFDQHTRRAIVAIRDVSSREMPSMDDKSHSVYSGKSSYSRPPLEHYQYSYDLPQSTDYAPHEYANVRAVELGAAPSTTRRPQPAVMGQLQMVQAYGSMPAQSLVRAQSQSATVHGRSPSPGQHLSPYTTPVPTAEAPILSPAADMPLSPLPNPYGYQDGNTASYKLSRVPPPPPYATPPTSALSAEISPTAYNALSPALPNPYGE